MSWIWQAQGGGNGGGAAAAPVPQLQSNIASAVAMWSLDVDMSLGSMLGTDRSGNTLNLSSNGALTFPDIIPGGKASITWSLDTRTTSYPVGFQAGISYPALRLTGAMSVTFRAMKSAYPPPPNVPWTNYQYMVACGNGNDATANGNMLWSVGVSIGPTKGGVFYYSESGVKVGASFISTLPLTSSGLSSDGLWHFVAMRREASGVVTIDVDGSSQTSGALAPPTAGSTSRVFIGRPAMDPITTLTDIGLIGSVRDVCVWPSRLTDAQVLFLRKQSMGLP